MKISVPGNTIFRGWGPWVFFIGGKTGRFCREGSGITRNSVSGVPSRGVGNGSLVLNVLGNSVQGLRILFERIVSWC